MWTCMSAYALSLHLEQPRVADPDLIDVTVGSIHLCFYYAGLTNGLQIVAYLLREERGQADSAFQQL